MVSIRGVGESFSTQGKVTGRDTEPGSQRISHDLLYDDLLAPKDSSISERCSTFHTALASQK